METNRSVASRSVLPMAIYPIGLIERELGVWIRCNVLVLKFLWY